MNASANLRLIETINHRDVPSMLRDVADSIEAGEYGDALGCAVVLDAELLHVFYAGDGEHGPASFLLLHAGAAKFVRAMLDDKA